MLQGVGFICNHRTRNLSIISENYDISVVMVEFLNKIYYNETIKLKKEGL